MPVARRNHEGDESLAECRRSTDVGGESPASVRMKVASHRRSMSEAQAQMIGGV